MRERHLIACSLHGQAVPYPRDLHQSARHATLGGLLYRWPRDQPHPLPQRVAHRQAAADLVLVGADDPHADPSVLAATGRRAAAACPRVYPLRELDPAPLRRGGHRGPLRLPRLAGVWVALRSGHSLSPPRAQYRASTGSPAKWQLPPPHSMYRLQVVLRGER